MSGFSENIKNYLGLKKETIKLRNGLSHDLFFNETVKFIATQFDLIELELLSIVVEASKNSDDFWAVALASRDNTDGRGKFCRIGTRVVFKNGTFSAEWYFNNYVAQGEGKPKKVLSNYIRKGQGFSYNMSSFNKEPKWVRELVVVTESKYALLRERASYLTKLRTTLKTYERRIKRSP